MEVIKELFDDLCYITSISEGLCNELYHDDISLYVTLSCLLLSFFMAIIFYNIIDSPSFQKSSNWIFMLFVNLILNFIVGILIPQQSFMDYDMVNYIKLGINNAIFSILFYSIGSILGKHFSKNCKTTPF